MDKDHLADTQLMIFVFSMLFIFGVVFVFGIAGFAISLPNYIYFAMVSTSLISIGITVEIGIKYGWREALMSILRTITIILGFLFVSDVF